MEMKDDLQDEQGRELSFDVFNPDGSWSNSQRYKYGNDGTGQYCVYAAKDKGKISYSYKL